MTTPHEIVSLRARPDLIPTVASWLWGAFWRPKGHALSEVATLVARSTARVGTPQGFALLGQGGEPVGTASLVDSDCDERPDLSPWLAGVFVHPERRGRGHATALVGAVESAARTSGFKDVWLYTRTAERLYARIGWASVETFASGGKPAVLMRRDLQGCRQV